MFETDLGVKCTIINNSYSDVSKDKKVSTAHLGRNRQFTWVNLFSEDSHSESLKTMWRWLYPTAFVLFFRWLLPLSVPHHLDLWCSYTSSFSFFSYFFWCFWLCCIHFFVVFSSHVMTMLCPSSDVFRCKAKAAFQGYLLNHPVWKLLVVLYWEQTQTETREDNGKDMRCRCHLLIVSMMTGYIKITHAFLHGKNLYENLYTVYAHIWNLYAVYMHIYAA